MLIVTHITLDPNIPWEGCPLVPWEHWGVSIFGNSLNCATYMIDCVSSPSLFASLDACNPQHFHSSKKSYFLAFESNVVEMLLRRSYLRNKSGTSLYICASGSKASSELSSAFQSTLIKRLFEFSTNFRSSEVCIPVSDERTCYMMASRPSEVSWYSFSSVRCTYSSEPFLKSSIWKM